MSIDIIKQRLIERIQQGDENYIRVMDAVSAALNKVNESNTEEYHPRLSVLRVEELIRRAEEANEDYKAGRTYSSEEILAALHL